MDNTTISELSESISITVSNIEAEIKRLEKLKGDIQAECPHAESYARFNDKNSIRIFCVACNRELGYPNSNQIKTFLSNGY
jgi:DNA-binding MarR family transcriptional regulator